MNSVQENKISMYYKVDTFFNNNLTTLSVNAAALTDHVTDFQTALNTLENFEQIAVIDNSGFALQKQQNRNAMRDLAMPIVGALRAFASATGDPTILRKASMTKSDIDKGRDTEALFMGENIRDLVTTHGPALIPFGITAAKISAYTAALDAYRQNILSPGDARSEASAAGKQVDKAMNDIDALLVIIDGIMEAQSLDFPLLFDQYKLDRLIDDNASGQTPPDVVATILAGEFKSVYTVPFLASRTFKAKNNSNEPLEWCLSSALNSFSNPPKSLLPNAISQQQSISLAPDGDNLVFHNPGAVAVEVEITITED